MERPRTVSIAQACVALGVSRRTIYNYIAQGKLTTMRTIGGSQRILVSDLQKDPRYMEPRA